MSKYCIIQNSSGDRWVCPVDKKDEVERNIREIECYWENALYDAGEECPDDLCSVYHLPPLDGEFLTFDNPCIDGNPIFEARGNGNK